MDAQIITRGALLAMGSKPRRTQRVPVPELGEGQVIIVRAMSAGERGRYESQFIGKNGQTDPKIAAKARELLVVTCCVDENGNRMFTPEDIPALSQVDASVLDRICDVAKSLGGIGDNDFEELTKNCGPTPSGSLPSSSPSGSVPATSTGSSTL